MVDKEQILILYHNQGVEELFDEYAETFDEHLTKGLRYDVPNLLKKQLDIVIAAEMLPEAGIKGSNSTGTCSADEVKAGGKEIARTPRFKRCLDLGCGTGLAGVVFRDSCLYLEGNDISKAMVAKTKARGIYDRTVYGDLVSHLKRLADESFDLVISADVVMYVYDLAVMFKELRRVLEKGGTLVFSTESLEESKGDVVRLESERFAHSRTYVLSIAKDGFDLQSVENVLCRMDEGKEIRGDIFIFKRSQ